MAGAANAHLPIAAPRVTPGRVGLLASAVEVTGLDPHWVNGIHFESEACRGDDFDWWECPETGGDPPATPKDTFPVRPGIVRYRPIVLREHDTCSALGWQVADYQARARRQLEASQSRKLETELWTGAVGQAANYPNAFLSDATSAVDLGVAPLVYALTVLQQYLADTIDGRGMIHCTRPTATLWQHAQVIRREGPLLLDLYDNIVVAGAGYDGSGPGGVQPPVSGDRAWAYATGMVHYALDTIMVTPGDISEALDRDTNTVTFQAERYAGVWWDSNCAHAAIEVDLCQTCCEPSGS